jgi:beta-lactamase regulating signal transducer with metallopeptidase domain
MRVILSTVLLGLAWFAALNAALSALSWLLAVRVADEVIPDVRRSRRLLGLRLLPFVASATITLALFAPAHLRLEPVRAEERYGVILVALAIAALFLLARSAFRCVTLISTGRRLAASIGGLARDQRSAWIELPRLSGIALAGVLRPRVLIGSEARQALSSEELDVAVEHERAHQRARDNLTRALIWCAPDFLGFTPAARRIERLWEGQAECLADARAVDGCPERASSLASALVKVARLPAPRAACSMWSMFHQPALLETRVRLLVDRDPTAVTWDRIAGRRLLVAAGVITVAWLFGFPVALHRLTELLIAVLP